MHCRLRDFIHITWLNLNRRTVNGSYPDRKNPGTKRYIELGIELRFSKQEFIQWARSHNDQIGALYDAGERPSIDRIDPNGHYELGNISVISLRENRQKGSETNKRNALSRMKTGRKCVGCSVELLRKPKEAVTSFNARKHCTIECYLTNQGRTRNL